jgi:hypothetical protein
MIGGFYRIVFPKINKDLNDLIKSINIEEKHLYGNRPCDIFVGNSDGIPKLTILTRNQQYNKVLVDLSLTKNANFIQKYSLEFDQTYVCYEFKLPENITIGGKEYTASEYASQAEHNEQVYNVRLAALRDFQSDQENPDINEALNRIKSAIQNNDLLLNTDIRIDGQEVKIQSYDLDKKIDTKKKKDEQ